MTNNIEHEKKLKRSYEALGAIYWQVIQGLSSKDPMDARAALGNIQKSCLNVEPLLKNVSNKLVS